MNLSLTRVSGDIDGIFGELHSEHGQRIAETLEHAYPTSSGYAPKIPAGTYVCVRSLHRLHGMTEDFETFEITGVTGHEGLLFHWGNYNNDSEGCVLVGQDLKALSTGERMITNSRAEFAAFMALQEGVDTFTLVVS
jgi:hypothetical protein